MAKSIDKIFSQIDKNRKSIAIDAMESAMQKAYDLASQKARSCLQNYYDSYTPTSYSRGYKLHNAIKYNAPKHITNGKTHDISFSIEYDSSLLPDNYYHSASWYHQSGSEWKSVAKYQTFDQNNGVPDTGWILDNYLHGIHPRYVGSPNSEVVNKSVQDEQQTMTEMTKFFKKELPSMIYDIVNEEMHNAILKLIQG